VERALKDTMPRHNRGESQPQRPPARRGPQSRTDRGRAAGRDRSTDDARDADSKRGDGAGRTNDRTDDER
jgi:hypothetical protein